MAFELSRKNVTPLCLRQTNFICTRYLQPRLRSPGIYTYFFPLNVCSSADGTVFEVLCVFVCYAA